MGFGTSAENAEKTSVFGDAGADSGATGSADGASGGVEAVAMGAGYHADPLAAWLDVCPVRLTNVQRADVLRMLDAKGTTTHSREG